MATRMNQSKREIEERYRNLNDIYEHPTRKKDYKTSEIVEIIKETYGRDPTNEEWDIIFTYPLNEVLDQITFLNITKMYYKEKTEEQKSTK